MFGTTRVNSAGKTYSVRDIGEQHVMEDLGTIPTLEQWMKNTPIEPWMMGKKEPKSVTHIPFKIETSGEGYKGTPAYLPDASPRVSKIEFDDGTPRFGPKDILVD